MRKNYGDSRNSNYEYRINYLRADIKRRGTYTSESDLLSLERVLRKAENFRRKLECIPKLDSKALGKMVTH